MRVLGPIATEISFVGNFWSPFAIILGASIMCPTEKRHKRVCCWQDERQPWGNGDKLGHLPLSHMDTCHTLQIDSCPSTSCKQVLSPHYHVLTLEGTAHSKEPLGVTAGSKFAESLIRVVFSKRMGPKLKPAVCVSPRAMGTLLKCEQVSGRTIRMSAHILHQLPSLNAWLKHNNHCGRPGIVVRLVKQKRVFTS